MADGLAAIDWHAPWLQPWRALGEPVAQQVLAGRAQPETLNAQADRFGLTVPRFVPQAALPPGQAYEGFIFAQDQCPTREGLHDFFNGLAWLQFPHTKRRLNQLHVEQIAHTGIAPVRGPARDGLTVFDENAALLHAPDALWQALLDKDWQRVFVTLRPVWAEVQLVLFGHALLEKLVQPRKPITAHVYRTHAADNSLSALDDWLAAELTAERLASKPFAHLPVLGVPAWWSDNQNPDYYQDVAVFRLPRTAAPRPGN